MSVAVNNSTSWTALSDFQRPVSHPQTEQPLALRNNVELTREMLMVVLEYMSIIIASEFNGIPIRLVAHGGACMLLHPGLYDLANRKAMYHSSKGENVARRTTTRDVDYIRRSFVAEYTGRGILDAGERLKRCIHVTAQHFRLGADWMNSDADVALPMAYDSSTGAPYDPIYAASVQPNNIHLYTVFTSRNSKLTLINVTPFWAVALKLVRYAKWDPGDICLLLLNGTSTRGVKWSTEIIETWIRQNCSAMGYANYDMARVLDMKHKIAHAVQMLSTIGGSIMRPQDEPPSRITSPGTTGTVPSAWSAAAFRDTRSPFTSPPPPGVGASSVQASISSSSLLSPPESSRWSSGSPAPAGSVTSTSGTPWYGPASDALHQNVSRNEMPSHVNETFSKRKIEYVEELPEAFIPSYIETTRTDKHQTVQKHYDEKLSSRRKKERFRHLTREEARRAKYMLRAEEPDDSDEEEKEGGSSESDTDGDSYERPPPNPTTRISRSKSWASLQHRQQHIDSPFEQQRLQSPPHVESIPWTQSRLVQDPISFFSLSSHCSSPPPSSLNQSQPQFHRSTHSQTWPLTSQQFRSIDTSQQLSAGMEHLSLRYDS